MEMNPLEELKKARQKAIHENLAKWTATTRINIGMSTCEIAAGSKIVWKTIAEEIQRRKIKDVHLGQKGCVGRCHCEPTVEVFQFGQPPFKYENVDVKKAKEIVYKHLVRKTLPVRKTDLSHSVSTEALTDKSRFIFGDIPYFAKQKRIALRNCGVIDPESIDDYLAIRGYEALAKVLTEYTPARVIEEVTKSGLRGRGGGGFPTGLKWRFVAEQPGNEKYVICNADEGDPGAFMDRGVIEGDPFSVLEAMAICGFAVGAHQGIVYIRAEYPLAVARLRKAIDRARHLNLLGKNILGTDFSFDVDIVLGAGAFVCGEETALIHSIEGSRGMPRLRPPYPSVKGLWGKPTVINNVETWANIPVIILDGWENFAAVGTEKSKGTKVFALAGKVVNTGLAEVPLGMSLGEVIFDIGGGIKNGKKFKAAQTGGPSGGCLPVKFLNTPIDYESLTQAGSIMGSGGLIVMDEDDCMVDVAKFFLEFTQDESCGKCIPCREGTKRMLEILERITRGQGKEGDLEKLERLAQTIKKTALCGLGQTAPNPVLSTLRYFRNEYESHIRQRRCPAAVCAELFISPCQHSCPVQIDIPVFIGQIKHGQTREALQTILKRNVLPSVCGRVCHHPCQSHCRRAKVDQPVSIMLLKRFAADYDRFSEVTFDLEKRGIRPEKVAVVGSGPAGLACACWLARFGYQVTILEAEKKLGGMLRLGIPEYRLPRNILEIDINRIKKTGVKVKTGVRVGKDVTIEQLRKQGFKAFFLAIGAWKETSLTIPGTELNGVLGSLEFLKAYNTGQMKKMKASWTFTSPAGKVSLTDRRVAVIGGGNAAIDVARTCLRLGAKEVHVIYRRSREAMPAIPEEVQEAEAEGVKFHFLLIPHTIKGENGSVSGLECCSTRPGEFDDSGRRKAVPTEEKVVFPVEVIITAIGARPEIPEGLKELVTTAWGTIKVDPVTLATNIPDVFAGGDFVTGGGTVVDSMAQGEQAAISIDRYLRGEKLSENRFVYSGTRQAVPATDIPSDMSPKGAVAARKLPLQQRRAGFREVELGYDRKQAIEEASRCLRCDRKENHE